MTIPTDKLLSDTRRRRVRITAWAAGLVAAGIFTAFLLSAMLP